MSSVLDRIRSWTKTKQQAEAAQTGEQRATLATFVEAELSGRPLTKSEESQFAAMLESESLDEVSFRSAVEAARELRAAEAEVADCIAAGLSSKELSAARKLEMESRKAEDSRRERVDIQYGADSSKYLHRANQLSNAKDRLRRALPPGQSVPLANSKAALRGIQEAVNRLHANIIEADDLMGQFPTLEVPLVPLSQSRQHMQQYHQRVADHQRAVARQQADRDALAAMRTRMESLQEQLAKQQAEHDALEAKLLG